MFGGRIYGNDKSAILCDVEAYDIIANKWERMAAMTRRRCSGMSLVFDGFIYVFGGFSSVGKRSRVIEKYNHNNNTWTPYDLKLDISLESALLLNSPNSPGKFMLLGGNCGSGLLKSNRTYSFAEETILTEIGDFQNSRAMVKGFLYDNKIFVFGGDKTKTNLVNTTEMCDLTLPQKEFTIQEFGGKHVL